MSTSLDSNKNSAPEDRLISLLSHWLARHVDNAGLQRGIEEIGTTGLGRLEVDAVKELLVELGRAEPGKRGGLEMLVRETMEALALG
jgi:hypothetical protein